MIADILVKIYLLSKAKLILMQIPILFELAFVFGILVTYILFLAKMQWKENYLVDSIIGWIKTVNYPLPKGNGFSGLIFIKIGE